MPPPLNGGSYIEILPSFQQQWYGHNKVSHSLILSPRVHQVLDLESLATAPSIPNWSPSQTLAQTKSAHLLGADTTSTFIPVGMCFMLVQTFPIRRRISYNGIRLFYASVVIFLWGTVPTAKNKPQKITLFTRLVISAHNLCVQQGYDTIEYGPLSSLIPDPLGNYRSTLAEDIALSLSCSWLSVLRLIHYRTRLLLRR